ncbi:hypothetical protein HPB49_003227 [Dermacentor silvarum]|uniref:Uncharacterized protein n=1 Tax=Dermacentor silvarum TaxID=543639 RepID=A0ACB8C7B8_DERSI|nr:hypothetical protein HPB49_003227 [Dermacentor silvarum]
MPAKKQSNSACRRSKPKSGAVAGTARDNETSHRPSKPAQESTRPAPAQAPPAPKKRLPYRSVGTWTFQQGQEAPMAFVFSRRWRDQRKVEVGMAARDCPHPFRGRTLSDQTQVAGNAIMPADPKATFCNSCGVLVVHQAMHERSLVHKAKADNVEQSTQQPNATRAAQPACTSESLHSVAAALVAYPSFTAAIAAAVAASNLTVKEVSSWPQHAVDLAVDEKDMASGPPTMDFSFLDRVQ